ncbi:MAG TPA: class I SAM-dependent methyltransferase [Nocardioides sp.]|nr:class I SAM-dependent methyltransferase [Nocardioides sp.]
MRPGRPSFTARWVAAQRARLADQRPTIPTGRPELEAALYRSLGAVLGVSAFRPTSMAARTAFFDRETVCAIERGVPQIVIVGAGYDGRAARFACPAVRWFELDYPSTQEDKRRRLGPASDLATFVPIDLATDDVEAALDRGGHDARRPSLFMCEGLFAYLSIADGTALLASLRRCAAPTSGVAANFLVNARPKRVADAGLAVIGERRRARFTAEDPARMLEQAGWHVDSREATDRRRGEGLVLITGRATHDRRTSS